MLRILALLGAFALTLHAAGAEGHATSIVSRSGVTECSESDKLSRGRFALVHFRETVEKSPKGDEDGALRYDSFAARTPIVVKLEDSEIISGWVHGLEGACVKSNTTLVVPSEEAYGDNFTMRFVIEILKVADEEIEEPSMFDALDADGDGQISFEEFETYFKEFRKHELDEDGDAPMGLFMKEDINQNTFLNWEEFTGPKGTAPPSLAAAIIEREKADPELSKKRKGDPLKIVMKDKPDGKGSEVDLEVPKEFTERYAGAVEREEMAKAAAEAEKKTKSENAQEPKKVSDEL